MKDQFAFLSQKKFWIEIVALVAALLVGAAAVYYFLIPGNLILGSISGLAMVICSLLESAGIAMKVSVMVLILNAFLLILAYVFLGPEVGLKTIIASLLLGPFMDFWAWICPYDRLIEPGLTSVMGDPIFDLLGFVLLLGASQAFLFRISAYPGCLDGGIVVDYFTVSLNKRKRVCIISNEYEKIRQYIISTLCRGCSMYEVKGGFKETPGVEIQTILTQGEFASLMEFVRKEDIHAFITAGNCSEIYGLWRPNRKKVNL